jgi:hypothetical protein
LREILNTLPYPDAAFAVLAEMEVQRWVSAAHAHPVNNPYVKAGLNVMLVQLRAICLTAVISHTACSAMLEQLEGVRPLGDWGDVIEVCHMFCCLRRAFGIQTGNGESVCLYRQAGQVSYDFDRPDTRP